MPVGRFAFGRFDRRARLAISVAIAIVAIVAFGAAGCSSSPQSSASPSGIGAIMGGQDADSPQVTPAAAPTVSPSPDAAAPSPTLADADDEAAADSSPGASTTPGPTGVPIKLPVSGSAADRLPGEPNRVLTPGALNPAVTQATIGSTICVSGWTATIRPSSSYTTRLKIGQIASYGYSDASTSAYEEDHLISLELGGAPSDPRNLWPEPYAMSLADGRPTGARTKDSFENSLKKEVCAGTRLLAQAQADIGVYWVHAFYGIPFSLGTSTAGPMSAPLASAVVSTGLTAGAPAVPVASFSVSITSRAASVKHGANATLDVLTAPGATCGASVRYASGTISTAVGLQPQPVAGASGSVSWTWKVGTSTKPGTSTATVSCRLGTDTATAARTFEVT